MFPIFFEYPKFLLLLFLVPLFIFIYFFSFVYNKKNSVVFANFEAIERFYDVEFFSKKFISLYINIILLCLVIFSIAGTSVVFSADTSVYSYVIAIDTSLSMKTADIGSNRLDAAKTSAKRFVDMLPIGVEVGVIAFSGDSVIMEELDNSKYKTKEAIDRITYGDIQGTNIYNALITANKMFDSRNRKAVILISDGQLNVGSAPQLIKYANTNNLVVHTISVGTPKGGMTPLDTVSKTDENFMESLAFSTEGTFSKANDEQDLDESFADILIETNKDISVNISIYLLLAALVIFTFNWILYNFRFRVFP